MVLAALLKRDDTHKVAKLTEHLLTTDGNSIVDFVIQHNLITIGGKLWLNKYL